MSPLCLIEQFKNTFGRYPDESGGCLKFHCILKSIYPQAKGWYNSNHVITEISGVFYDIDGIVPSKEGFLPMEVFGSSYFTKAFHKYKTPLHFKDWGTNKIKQLGY